MSPFSSHTRASDTSAEWTVDDFTMRLVRAFDCCYFDPENISIPVPTTILQGQVPPSTTWRRICVPFTSGACLFTPHPESRTCTWGAHANIQRLIKPRTHVHIPSVSNARTLVNISCDKDNHNLSDQLAELSVEHTIEVRWFEFGLNRERYDGACVDINAHYLHRVIVLNVVRVIVLRSCVGFHWPGWLACVATMTPMTSRIMHTVPPQLQTHTCIHTYIHIPQNYEEFLYAHCVTTVTDHAHTSAELQRIRRPPPGRIQCRENRRHGREISSSWTLRVHTDVRVRSFFIHRL